jgi:hypothetical protein
MARVVAVTKRTSPKEREMRTKGIAGLLLAASLTVAWMAHASAADPSEQDETIGRTPPRLSFVDGQVSFWRPGAQDWVQAQVNIPLAPGDQLATGSPGNLELQIGARAFVRAWASTQIGLENQEPDFLQLRVGGGRVAFDLRTLESGHAVEVATPSAAFIIEQPGYYRVDVIGERTSFIARRAGRATVIPASGEPFAVAASEEVVLEGASDARIRSYAAPPLDEWDRWNYARTDALLDAVSARYVPAGVYGVDDLDRHGDWRVVDTYGPVWVPRGVPAGWAPYTTGSWVLDPFYGWTWVDTAPWGWAPYHYGRWVTVGGYWAWAPGPVVVRPAYAPALVAFFGGPGVQVSVGVGGPLVGWVALGWGEPCIPWWGRPGFVHRPWWGGWGGPRVVNNVVIQRTTVVNVEQITVYRNVQVRHAVVAVHEDRFGRGHVRPARVDQVDPRHLRPIHTGPRVSAGPQSFTPTERRGVRPPQEKLTRPVVATRPPHRWEDAPARQERTVGPGLPAPAPRLVTPPRREAVAAPARPPFGQSAIERPPTDRRPSPPRQPVEPPRRTERSPDARQDASREAAPRRQPETTSIDPSAARPPAPAARPEGVRPPERKGPAHLSTSSGQGGPGRGGRNPEAPATTTGPAPSRQSVERAAPPSPTPSQALSQRGVAPQLPSGRAETAKPQARALPGEPANRMAPNRGGPRGQPQMERQPGPGNGRPNGGSGREPGGAEQKRR